MSDHHQQQHQHPRSEQKLPPLPPTATGSARAAAPPADDNTRFKSGHHHHPDSSVTTTDAASKARTRSPQQQDENNNPAKNHKSNKYPWYKGTLSYNADLQRHIIRGMWNYQTSNDFPPQRFQLLRTLEKEEDPTKLPANGEFHGSFSLSYFHTTSKGKKKKRTKVIQEHGVKLVFTKNINKQKGQEEEAHKTHSYNVTGKGTNQFGIFHVHGTATPSQEEDDEDDEDDEDEDRSTYDVAFQKTYEPGTSSQPAAGGGGKKKRKRDNDTDADTTKKKRDN